MSAQAKDVKVVVRQVRRLPGWTVEIGRHIKFRKDGIVVAIAPKTPGDNRTMKNLRADLRRAGCPL